MGNWRIIVLLSGSTKWWCNSCRRKFRWVAQKYLIGSNIKSLISMKMLRATFGSTGFRKGPRAPHQRGPPTVFMWLAVCATCACHLVIFISEEICLSAGQRSSISLEEYWYYDETTITLIGFLKVDQVSESSECKAKPRRTCKFTSLLVSGRFCICFTQICTGRNE